MELNINIPTELNEITLEQYQQFLKAVDNNTDELFILQKMLQYFCDIDLLVSSRMSHKDIKYIATKLNDVIGQKPVFKNTFTLNGVEFGFEPSLDEMAITAYSDLDGYINEWETMHKAMAVLYRPITKTGVGNRYLIEPYAGTAKYGDIMKQMPVDIAISSQVFFWNLGKDLLTATLSYLENNKEVMSIAKKHNLLSNGGGMETCIASLRGTLLNSTSYQPYQFTKLLHI
jgi:hypothetical protein